MTTATLETRKTRTALLAFGGALAMLGLGYAAVPLYELFCQVTGFGGTTQRASESEAATAERLGAAAGGRTISIRFDGSTARDVPWSFRPEQSTDTVTIGQRDMAIYLATNNSDQPITGTATFNVEPEQAGAYFNKIQCFCFTEQTLQPGEQVRMPVLYFVDPKALDDPNMDGVEQITLSYTFHRAIESAD
ncbi:cytochrome c oxidase assembly protein [Qipengyuania sp. G39]|uniref:Cytochrome c oxidase assembly protein CtaG n=1 Tax=Qipengyuania profundimaris TaxID=3067652 RepID=A0ABT9HNN0_9SPHN|nr:cytochrome c oxidase assembly protein [Qipengyuania sp. G39]MDP4574752.1 cytochrome c oxidase assembly protein [Qipengyuania sp. G39]